MDASNRRVSIVVKYQAPGDKIQVPATDNKPSSFARAQPVPPEGPPKQAGPALKPAQGKPSPFETKPGVTGTQAVNNSGKH